MTVKEKTFTKKTKSSRPEIGASGTTNFQGIIDTDEYKTLLTGSSLYTTVDKMRWSDASVQAALLMCELPIRSAEWDIEPASDSPEDTEIAEFVKDNLFNGMTLSWDDILRQILLMHPYGTMAFEVIYKLTEDSKIGWRKWAPRLPKTIVAWSTDKNGELESITQRTYKNNEYVEITIPIEKLMVFVYRREGDNYLGTSILRQAYKHWFFRDKYYKIDAVATERMGIGIPIITLPDGFTDDDYDDADKLGKNIRGHERAHVVKKQGWEFEFADLKAGTLKDPKEMLEHHTREILKSVLAQFLDLGSKSVGSYALQTDQSAFFLQSLDASAKLIGDVVDAEIQKLVDYNWTVEKYPKLSHSDLGIKDVKALSEAIQALTFAGVLTGDPELEDYMRNVLKLPPKPEGAKRVQQPAQSKNQPGEKPQEESNGGDSGKKKDNFSEPRRQLTKAEQRVRFDEIRDYMDTAENNLIGRMLSILAREKARLIPAFERAIRNNDFAALQNISWQLKSQYAGMFREEIKKLFEYGKLKSSYEVKKPAPRTTPEIMSHITSRAVFLADYEEKKMLEDMKGIAAVAMMDSEVSPDEALERVKTGFDKFKNRSVPATASLTTSGEINNGRKYTFDTFKEDIYGYQWSAILDDRICNYCMSMDGRVIGIEDKAFSEYRPGHVHFHCRCIWVAILQEEANPPPFTGIPATLRPQSQVATWEFKDLEYPLAGSGKRKMPYGVGVFKSKKYPGLPDDVIWRTIGGKRVPINPKTGRPVEKGKDGRKEKEKTGLDLLGAKANLQPWMAKQIDAIKNVSELKKIVNSKITIDNYRAYAKVRLEELLEEKNAKK